MKTTTWLCPVLTLLCAAKLVYTAQRGSYDIYPWDNVNAQMLQSDDYFLSKRNKPSLSIVNPLDVLRKRLLLEIARRQMKENSRQVELNRAILKNVGKRMASKYSTPLTATSYDGQRDIQQQQQHDPLPHTQLYDYELIPTTLIFDYLQQRQQQKQRLPWLLPYDSTAAQFDNNYPNDFIVDAASEDDADYGVANAVQDIIKFNGIVANNDKHFLQNIKQSNNDEHANSPNVPPEVTTFQKSINGNINNDNNDGNTRSNSNKSDVTKRFTLINNRQHHRNDKNDFSYDPNDANLVPAKTNQNDYKNELRDNADDYRMQRYFYHLHKNQNHLTRK